MEDVPALFENICGYAPVYSQVRDREENPKNKNT